MPRSDELQPRSSAAIASGIGSMPGTSAREAVEVIAGELPDLPFLPELPARGVGGDMIGRTAGLISQVARDLSIEPIPTGWRLCGSPTRVTRQAQSWLSEDLDRSEERFSGSPGRFKVQMAGPWTMAAAIETSGTGLALNDAGLVAELGEALTIACSEYVAETSRRIGSRQIVLQIDEPTLPAVLRGQIRTPSGLGRYAPVSAQESAALLTGLAGTDGVAQSVLHCCGRFPFESARLAGFDAISLDLLSLHQKSNDEADAAIAAQVEAGVTLFAGVVPTDLRAAANPEQVAESGWLAIDGLWRRSGLDRDRLRGLVVTPTCGLAGSSWPQARAALVAALEIAHRCSDQ